MTQTKSIDDPTLTLFDADLRLSQLAERLASTVVGSDRQHIVNVADTWLDRRAELQLIEEMKEATKEAV